MAVSWLAAIVLTMFRLPGGLVLAAGFFLAAKTAKRPPYDSKDKWGRPSPTLTDADTSAARARDWFAHPWSLLPSGPDAAVSLGLGLLAGLPMSALPYVAAQTLGVYLWCQAFWDVRRQIRDTRAGRCTGVTRRRVTWAKTQTRPMLIALAVALAIGLPAGALTECLALPAILAAFAVAIPYRTASRAAKHQADDELKVAGMLRDWLESFDKPPVGRFARVANLKKGANGEYLFSLKVSDREAWANAKTSNAFAPYAQPDGYRCGFVIDGKDSTQVIGALIPLDHADPADIIADKVSLIARLTADEPRIGACYGAIPGRIVNVRKMGERDGRPACWTFALSGTNADWGSIGTDWLKGNSDPKFGDWCVNDGLLLLADPSGTHGWALADDGFATIEYDEDECAKQCDTRKIRLPRGCGTGDYLALMCRDRTDKAKWATACSAFKLSPPVTFYYDMEETLDGDGWSLTRLPMTIPADGGQVADYMGADFRAAFGDSLIADILPMGDRAGWRKRFMIFVQASRSGNSGLPTELRHVFGDAPASRLLAQTLASRAFATTLKKPALVGDARQMSRSDGWTLWRMPVELTGGVTAADARKAQNRLKAMMGADVTLWQWLDDARLILWAGDRVSHERRDWRSPRDRETAVRLELDQCWAAAGAVAKDGRSVTTVDIRPDGDMIHATFRLPAGLTQERVDGMTSGFMTAAGYGYMKPEPSDGPGVMRLLLGRANPLPDRASADMSVLDPSDPRRLPFGILDNGAPAVWDVRQTPHLLASGTTGSGKSSVSVTLARMALESGWQVAVTDPSKGANDFRPIRDRLIGFEDTLPGCQALVEWAYREMLRRVAMIKANGGGDLWGLPSESRPAPILLFVDEVNSLLGAGEKPMDNPADDPEIENMNIRTKWENGLRKRIGLRLSLLLCQSRSAGIAVLLGAQQLKAGSLDALPDAGTCKEMLGRVFLGSGETAGNISARHVREANRMLRQAGVMPKGRGLYEPLGGGLDMVQCWWSGAGAELAGNLADMPAVTPIDLSGFMPAPPQMVGETLEPEIVEEVSLDDDDWELD